MAIAPRNVGANYGKKHNIQKCAFVGANRVCKSTDNARNEQYESQCMLLCHYMQDMKFFVKSVITNMAM